MSILLNYIYPFSAYLNHTLPLALLDQSQMQTWLEPLSTEIELIWKTDHEWLQLNPEESKENNQEDQELDEVAKIQQAYYSKLTDLSQGISNVASDLWWRSLSCEKIEEEDHIIYYYQAKVT
ncbi:MAG: hypothetical protein QNJ32_10155 [Xenococcaceae cyanobacterium MO_167.B27]|nr:hypothetical protein [Xenococcaceae cyanobacterium MO_167.B27]